MAEFMDDGGGALDRFTRSTGPPAMFSGDGGGGSRVGPPSLSSMPGSVSVDPGSNLSSAGGSSFPATARGGSPFDGGAGAGAGAATRQHQVAAAGGGGGQPAEMEMSGYDGKDLDWSVFSASPSMFNISGGGGSGGAQSQSSRSQQGSPGEDGGGGGGSQRGRQAPDLPPQHQLSGLPPPSSGRPVLGRESSGDHVGGGGAMDMNTQSHGSRSSSLGGGGGGSCGVLGLNSGSRTGSFSSGDTGTPPLAGRSMATAPWNIMGGPPVRSVDGGGGGGAPPRAESSPRAAMSMAGTLANMKKLSITSDDSNSGVSWWSMFVLVRAWREGWGFN